MSILRQPRRSPRALASRLACRPSLESFEKRELLTATPFLQGTVFVDPVGSGTLTPSSTPLAGATVNLYLTGSPAVVASAITGADGGYYFDNLAANQSYTLVETPPLGYASDGAQAFSQVAPASVLTTSSIQATPVDPTKVVANYQGLVSPFNGVTYSVIDATHNFNSPLTSINQLAFSLSGAPGVLTSTFNTYCVDATSDLASPGSFATLLSPQTALPNGGRIAYLYNHFGTPNATAASFPAAIQSFDLKNLQAGVQVAIWDLEYNNGATTGAFNLTGYNTGYTSATDYAQIQSAAAALLTASAGKSEKVAVLDASLTGNAANPSIPNPPAGSQSVLAAETFNFFNVASGSSSNAGAALSGTVYNDTNRNLSLDGADLGIPGVTVTLTGTVNGLPITPVVAQTNAQGKYSFPTLAPGVYTVTESQPAQYVHEGQTIGSTAGTVGDHKLTTTLAAGSNSVNNNFAEVNFGSVSGFVYLDADNSGTKDAGEAVGIGGVKVTATAVVNGVTVTASAVTAADGSYSIAGLAPGTYTLTETNVPAPYQPDITNTGKLLGVVVVGGANTPNENFGELLYTPGGTCPVSSICYTIQGPCGTTNAPDLGGNTHQGDQVTVSFYVSAPVTLTLVSYTATSNFDLTKQSVFGVDTETFGVGQHTLTVTIPNSYYQIDFVCGGAIYAFNPAANLTYHGQNRFIDSDNGGCQDVSGPAGLGNVTGTVFFDANNNGLLGAGDAGIGGVAVTLTGVDAKGKSVTLTRLTAADGSYTFLGLQPGTYAVKEAQPSGYLDGLDAKNGVVVAGSAGSSSVPGIVVAAGSSSTATFGELKPGSLSGYVYLDANNNGLFESGDKGIAGVALTLTGTNDLGAIVAVKATTDANGYYNFAGLRPGTYTVTEAQPAGYLDGLDARGGVVLTGSVGTDAVAGIAVGQNSAATANNFGEKLAPRALGCNQTATICFWDGCSGQALINSLNGGASRTNLGHWLATKYSNLFGGLDGKTNSQVGDYFEALYDRRCLSANAEVMAVALAAYATDETLAGGKYAQSYGFTLVPGGSGACTFDAGNTLACYGGPTGKVTLYQLLQFVDGETSCGKIASCNPWEQYAIACLFDQINACG